MANFSILNIAGAGITSARFFQPGATFLLSAQDSFRLTNPDGTIVDIVGTGFTFNGANVPTGGTISAITLYQSDFATQLAGFTGLGTSLPGLHARWLGATPGNVFNLLLSGNDTVNGSAGGDSLFGAAGNDLINGGTGDDYMEPGRGTDTVDGGGGGDTLSYADAGFDPAVTKGVTLDLSLATVTDPWGDTDSFTGILHARGTRFADTLTGTAGANRFEPLAGNDVVNGGAGLDQVRYNRDTTYGGTLAVTVNLALGTATDGFGDTDTLNSIEGARGTELADTLIGGDVALGPGDVYELYGLGGDDNITAGTYDIYTEPGAGNDTITGGASAGDQVSYAEYAGANGALFDLPNNKISDPYGGTDTLIGSIEQVRGTRNADTIIGNALNNVVRGLGGNDAINGGAGIDQVRYDRDAQFGGTKGVTVNLATGVATDGFGDTDTLVSIENIRGSMQADTLIGDGNVNVLQGLAGNDTLNGGGGLDAADYSVDAIFGGGAGVAVNLASGTATDGFGNADTLISIETARGTAGNDTLVGGNVPLGGTDIYTLHGGDGDDSLTAGSHDSLLNPGAGNDTVTGGAGSDQIGYEEYTGANGAVINLATGLVADPFGGIDTVTGVEGVRGTRNADAMTGNGGNNYFRGLDGADFIDGGGGIDQVRYDRDAQAGGTKGVEVNLAAGTATDGFGNSDTLVSIENVRGSNSNDTLGGDANDNAFQGMGGADTIDGRGGQDTADYSADALAAGITGVTVNLATGKATDGQGATDTLVSIEGGRGGAGADTLIGGDIAIPNNAYLLFGMAGNDTIKAGSFDAYIEPGAGDDTISGGPGFDQVSYSEYTGATGVDANLGTGVVVDPYGGKDTITGGIEGLRGTRNADVLIGNDAANQFRGLNGSDFINGGGGLDRVRYDRDAGFGGGKGVVVDLGKGTATDGFGNADTLVSIEQVEGTAFADTLTGGDAGLGPGTSYDLYGRGGDDILIGGTFSVYIEPGAGNDTVKGGAGPNDQISYADFTNGVGVVLDLTKGSVVDPLGGTDTFTGIENVRGTNSADTITGDGGTNQITGLRGADTLDGGAGVDMVRYDRDANYGGTAAVVVDLSLGAATDGFGNTDTLLGFEDVRGSNAADGDTLIGNNQNNRIQGLRGDDLIVGGAGIDTVDYSRDIADGGLAGIAVDLDADVATDGFGGLDILDGIENAIGTIAEDLFNGSAGDNVFTGLGGGDVFDGRAGVDTVVYSLPFSAVTVATDLGVTSIQYTSGGKLQEDILLNVEFAQFSDQKVSIAGPDVFSLGAPQRELEGADGTTTPFFFVIERNGTQAGSSSVSWSVAGVGPTAANAADFVGNKLPSGVVSFAPGELRKLITMNVAGDSVGEADESFEVVLGTPSAGAFLGLVTKAIGTIGNDDTSFRVAANTANQTEGNSGTKTFSFTVYRDGALDGTNAVKVGVAGAGASPATAADFSGGVLPSQVLTFGPGVASRTFTVSVAGDTAVEADEGFSVVLSAPTGGAALDIASVTRTILNDDTASASSSFTIAGPGAGLAEGPAGGTMPFTFTVQRSGNTAAAETVKYSVAGNGATPATAADFAGGVLPGGTLSFAAGETSRTVTITVAGDGVAEANEGFAVSLLGAADGKVLAGTTSTIYNDDTTLSIAATSANKPEGTGAAGATTPFTFTVTRTGAPGVAQSVAWSVAGVAGTGTQPADAADFAGGVLPSGVVSFAAGETSRVISVPVLADAVGESNDRFAVTLASPTGGAVLGTASAGGIIQNNDTSLRVLAGGAMTQAEGQSGARAYSFVVQRLGIASGTSTVAFSVAGTGAAPANAADFVGGVLPSGTLTFLAGETSKTVTVNVAGDTVQEADEGFQLVLANATGAAISGGSLGAVIQSDDSQVSIAATRANKAEGTGAAGATTPFTFTVTRSGATGVAQSVAWSVNGTTGSGTQPADAADFAGGVLPTGVVSFAPGETSRVITVPVAADALGELGERFAVVLTGATNGAQIVTSIAQGIIQNDDTSLRVVAVSPDQTEGNTTRPFTFTVQRQGITTGVSAVDYAVAGAGANPANTDDFNGGFLFPAGRLTFLAGETSKTVTITVQGDNVAEADEGFQLVLSNATGAAIATASAARTIINDDTLISVAATSANKPEGTGAAGATTPFTFTVTRSSAAGLAQAVNWAVSGANGTGTAPATVADFAGSVFPSGTITFAPGETSRVVTVNVVAETVPEANDRFAVTLSAPTNGATLGTPSAQGIIQNDDVTLAVAASSANLLEGDDSSRAYTFTVTRAGAGGAPTVNWAVQGSGAFPANAADFVGGVLPSGTVSFAGGQTSRTITVLVAGDTAVERSEDFRVVLSNPVGGKITTDSATRTILSDDGTLTITPLDAVKAEGAGGVFTPFTFLLTRTGGDGIELAAVAAAQAVPDEGVASASSDFGIGAYPSMATGLAIGEASRIVTITVANDDGVEADEHFDVALSSPSPGTYIGGTPARGIILNDDAAISIAAASANKPEGTGPAGATTPYTFTLTRSGFTNFATTVPFSVAGIAGTGTSAADAADFAGGVLPAGTVTFAPGQTTRTLTIAVAADGIVEGNQRFAVTLGTPSGEAMLGTASAQGIVVDDDTRLRATGGDLAEGQSGLTQFSLTVQRDGIRTGVSTVDFALTGFGATPASAADFAGGVFPTGSVTFAPGESSKVVTFDVIGDTVVEPDEGYAVVLSNATGGIIEPGGAGAAGSIIGDESTVAIRADNASRGEGASGTTAFTFVATRSGSTASAQALSWSVAGATGSGTVPATAGDFPGGVFPSGTITFAQFETIKVITVNVAGDTVPELGERFAVTFGTPPIGMTLTNTFAQGIIRNDDFASTAANQSLFGSVDPDVFLLGGGLDTVTGLGGVDSFRFLEAALGTSATNATTIQDFNPVAGERLDLSAIDAIAGTLANDAFTFNPTAGAGFSGAGSLVWQGDGDRVAILGDTNGDFAADLTIFVRPVGTPEASWFIL
jgi:Ca2+-binding RTX toxin-like protein